MITVREEKSKEKKVSTYLCGDIQSCFSSFQAVLKKANFKLGEDKLILAGDIINRGPESLETISWIYENRKSLEL